MSPPRKASTPAPSRKRSTSDAPVKQTSTVVGKSKETASKAQASDQDDVICPECELLVDEDSKAIACDVCVDQRRERRRMSAGTATTAPGRGGGNT